MRRSVGVVLAFFLVLPASTTYELHDYGFGAGGAGVAESSSYGLSAVSGEVSSGVITSSSYDLGPGLQFARQTNTPAAPTFTNPSSYYNKLRFVLDTGGNPSDTLFAIAISSDSFVTTNYIQADNTIGATPVYQTYTTWGGASGANVIGLAANTTYQIKVKAVQTKYTESAFSAAVSAATVAPSLTYDIDVSSTDSESSAPYALDIGQLSLGSVTTASNRIWVDLSTNADNGAFVYLYSDSAGLTSSAASYTLTSASGDLTAVSEGFGIRSNSVAQSSGGPLVAVSPYAGSNDVVGVLDTTSRELFNSSNAPITSGRGSVLVKAKASTTTPSASDYSAIVTMIASATF